MLCMSVHTNAGAADVHKRAPDPLEPELFQVFVSCSMWVLRIP